MEILILDRRHGNGVMACVHRESEGAGYRPSSIPPREEADPEGWPYCDTIDEAQAAADAAAHPGCTGQGCGRWVGHAYRPVE